MFDALVVNFTDSFAADATAGVQYDGMRLRIVSRPGLAVAVSAPAGASCVPSNASFAVQCMDVRPSSPPSVVEFHLSSALSQAAGIPATAFLPVGGTATLTGTQGSLVVVY